MREILTVLQHPLRFEIHEMLRAAREAMSTEAIAAAVTHNHRGVRSHLRALQYAGLALERRNFDSWVATTEPVRMPAMDALDENDPDRPLVAAMWRMMTERRAGYLATWAVRGTQPEWAEWCDRGIGQEGVVKASPHQVGQLEEALLTVLREFRARWDAQPEEGAVPVYIEVTAAPLAAVRRSLST